MKIYCSCIRGHFFQCKLGLEPYSTSLPSLRQGKQSDVASVVRGFGLFLNGAASDWIIVIYCHWWADGEPSATVCTASIYQQITWASPARHECGEMKIFLLKKTKVTLCWVKLLLEWSYSLVLGLLCLPLLKITFWDYEMGMSANILRSSILWYFFSVYLILFHVSFW